MNDQKRKSLDECSDESEHFERQFERLFGGEGDDSARARLITEITGWLQDCAKQGVFLPLGGADRRALRSLIERWRTGLRRQGLDVDGIGSLGEFDPNAGIVLIGDCPFPGLEPYTERWRSSFFGQEALVSSSVAHLERQGNRILLIIGGSGSGKSSLALAGILTRLKELHDGAWLFGPQLTPGTHPLVELAASVAKAIGQPDQASEIETGLAAEPGTALGQLAEWCQAKPLMLLIDQFEELLTLCRDAEEQSAFSQVLCALSDPSATAGDFCCRILLTLRTDHLARFENNDALKTLHMRLIRGDNERYLSAMGFEEIKRAIKEPADAVGLRFIPATLIDQLASQTAGLSNGLPLLQFALRCLWDRRPRNEFGEPLDLITEEMVKALPDVERALGTEAERVFQTLSSSQQRICERLLLELVVLDETFEEPLRRRRNEDELKNVLEARFASTGDVERVIEDFVAAGLLRRFGEEPHYQLEVAHEALLRHWDRIYRLMTDAEGKDRLHLIKQLGREAYDWVGAGKTDDYLNLRGERLHRAIAYAEEGWLAEEKLTAYIEACRKQEERERLKEQRAKEEKERAEAAERAREAAELRAEHSRRQRTQARRVAAFALIALTFVVVALVFSWMQWQQAKEHKQGAERARARMFASAANNVSASGDAILGVKLALEATKVAGSSADAVLRADLQPVLYSAVAEVPFRQPHVLTGHKAEVTSVEFSPQGTHLVSIAKYPDLAPLVWDVLSGQLITSLEGHSDEINAAQFSPDGSRILTASSDRTVRLWDAGTGEMLAQLEGHRRAVVHATFSPTGQYIASGARDDTVRVWDAETMALVAKLAGHEGDVLHVAFSPSGKQLVSASHDGTARVWDPVGGRELARLQGHTTTVTRAFFISEERVLTASDDRTARMWDARTGSKIVEFGPHGYYVTDVEVVSDGVVASVCGVCGYVYLWDSQTGKQLAAVESHQDTVTDVAFTHDRHKLVTTSKDNTARLWSFDSDFWNDRSPMAELLGHRAAVTRAAFSPDDRWLATASDDKTVRLWSLQNKLNVLLQRHTQALTHIELRSDGARAVTSSKDGTAVIWDVVGQQEPVDLLGHTSEVLHATFNPDRTKILTSAHDATAIIWDAVTGRQLVLLGPYPFNVHPGAFHPQGTSVAIAAHDGKVYIENSQNGQRIAQLDGTSFVTHVEFDAKGNWLLSTHEDGTARLSRAADGTLVHQLVGHRDRVNFGSFSPDGQKIVTASSDGSALVWNTKTGEIVSILAKHTAAVNYARFRSDGRAIVTASTDSTAIVWDLPSGEPRARVQHRASVTMAKFNKTGTRIVTASDDHTAQVWNAETGAKIARLKHQGKVIGVDFTPDGDQVLTGSRHRGQLWQILEGDVLADYAMDLVPDVLNDQERNRLVLGKSSTDDSSKLSSDPTRILAKRGEILLLNGKGKEGLAAFEKARALNPEFKVDWEELAVALRRLNRLDQAVDMLREIAESKPEHPEVWGELGEALRMRGGEGDDEEALVAYRKQLDIRPEHPYAWFGIGLAYELLDNLEEAVSAYEQHTVTNQNDERGWQKLSLTLYSMGRRAEAIAAFQQNVTIRPDSLYGWYLLGLTHFEQGDLPKAVEALTRQVDVVPSHQEAWDVLGHALEGQGKLTEALDAYQQQAKVFPEHTSAHTDAGNVLRQLGRTDEAVKALKRQIEVNNKAISELPMPPARDSGARIALYNNTGIALYKLKDYSEAERMFAQGLDRYPDDRGLLANDAELALVQGDHDRFRTRLEALPPTTKPSDQEYVVMPFFSWLADPALGYDPLLEAIETMDEDVNVSWDFADLEPVFARLSSADVKRARAFIDYFKGRTNLVELRQALRTASGTL